MLHAVTKTTVSVKVLQISDPQFCVLVKMLGPHKLFYVALY